MPSTVAELLSMFQPELDNLFRQSPSGPIPNGNYEGTALVRPGSRLEGPAARLVQRLIWRGKVIDAGKGMLANKIAVFNIHAVKAEVYAAASWFDGNEAIILDYSKTSFIARKIRDEIREIAPGLYLGQVYLGKYRVLNFVLNSAP
jgi:hypothetical protein